MQPETQDFFTDTQKNIVLSYLPLNPGILETSRLSQKMVEELNASCDRIQDHSTWSTLIRSWKESVRKDYFYTKKMRSNIFLIEDLQLLLHMKDSLDDAAEELINPENNIPCRICNTKVDKQMTTNIFKTFVDDNLSLGELLKSFTKISAVEQDDFSEEICFQCVKLFKMLHNFRVICEKSDLELQQALNAEKSDEFPELEANVSDFLDEETISVYQDELPYDDKIEDSSTTNLQKSEITFLEKPKEKKLNPTIKTREKNKLVGNKQCDQCGKTFSTPSSLRVHKKRVHLKYKPHSCELCGKHFRTRLEIKVHIRSHTNERPYVCETCGKRFKTLSATNVHKASHLPERLFHCTLCTYRASTKANLKIHERTHSGAKPYSCQICGISFMTASNKQKHIRNIHKKQRTHKCPFCDRYFFVKKSAIKHAVTHTGEKPYKCPICTLSYGWYNGLQKHMRTQHQGVEVPKEKTFFEALELIILKK